MQLSKLSDELLDQKMFFLVRTEREVLTEILHHLREVERRRLFSKYQLSSLFDYTVKRLGYSEDQAARRISAMRLMKDLPEIEEKIADGSLTLTNINQAQTLFRQERKFEIERSKDAKLEVLFKLENCSKREAQAVIEKESRRIEPMVEMPKLLPMEFMADDQLQEKISRLMKLKSPYGTLTLADLIGQICDLALEKWDPFEKAKRAQVRLEKSKAGSGCQIVNLLMDEKTTHNPDQLNEATFAAKEEANRKTSKSPAARPRVKRYIHSAVKHYVRLRDKNRCTNCGSDKALEFDHVIPYAMGGANDAKNIRLLCRSCNQRHAIERYGTQKIKQFVRAERLAYSA